MNSTTDELSTNYLYQNAREDLLRLLKTRAYREGTFTLASGKTSDFYINCKDVVLSGTGHLRVAQVLSGFLGTFKELPRTVAGVALGGCPLASAVAMIAGMNALYVRKEEKDHGIKSLVEGIKNAPKGSKVVLLEDVATTGGSSLKAIQVLREAGYLVEDAIVLVDRLEGASENLREYGVTLHSIFTRKDFVTQKDQQGER